MSDSSGVSAGDEENNKYRSEKEPRGGTYDRAESIFEEFWDLALYVEYIAVGIDGDMMFAQPIDNLMGGDNDIG